MKKSSLPIIILLGVAGYYFFSRRNYVNTQIESGDKRQALVNWVQTSGESTVQFITAINNMSTVEINAYYDFVFNYIKKGVYPQQGSALYNAIQAINYKYNLGT